MTDFVLGGMQIPSAAMAELGSCATADDVKRLAARYNIEVTDEMAASVLAADEEELVSLNGGCGDPEPAPAPQKSEDELAEERIETNEYGVLTKCPYCGENYPVQADCMGHSWQYTCNSCHRFFSHDTDTNKLTLYGFF